MMIIIIIIIDTIISRLLQPERRQRWPAQDHAVGPPPPARSKQMCVCVYIYIYIYVYTYMHIEREMCAYRTLSLSLSLFLSLCPTDRRQRNLKPKRACRILRSCVSALKVTKKRNMCLTIS